MIQIPDHTDL